MNKTVYTKPVVLSHQPIQFETAQSWNPGKGKHDHPGTGNGGINFGDNPNPQPCGAGDPGKGNKNGSLGTGQCNPKVN